MFCIYTPRMTALLVAKVRQSLISHSSLFQQNARTIDPFAKVMPNSIPNESIKAECDRVSRDRYPEKGIGMLLTWVEKGQKGQITAESELGRDMKHYKGQRMCNPQINMTGKPVTMDKKKAEVFNISASNLL